jgi:hypothetical protein
MQYLQPYPLFEALVPVPSHEALSQLPEWQRMSWCEPQWITAPRAYSNGTRSLRITPLSSSASGYTEEYRIYPEKGNLTNEKNSLMSGLKFDSLEDWNDSLLKINAYFIYKSLSKDRFGGSPLPGIEFKSRVPIEKALRGSRIKSTEDALKILLYKGETDAKRAIKLIPLLYDTDPAYLSDTINQRIEENPSSISTDTLKAAIDKGLLVPSEFTQTMIGVGDFGLFNS